MAKARRSDPRSEDGTGPCFLEARDSGEMLVRIASRSVAIAKGKSFAAGGPATEKRISIQYPRSKYLTLGSSESRSSKRAQVAREIQ